MKTKILSLILCLALCISALGVLASCGKKQDGTTPNATNPDAPGSTGKKPDALVVMTEDLDGLFNPFYSTTANDATIVAMTQLGMITTDYVNGEVVEAYGDEHAVVVKDYMNSYNAASDKTTYTFVIKNGLKFSDGKPLTMHDVLFNMYVYLDPTYAGSSTMYSIDIVGLQEYRTQQATSGSTGGSSAAIDKAAQDRAQDRINELINVFKQIGKTGTQGSYYASVDDMKAYLATHNPSDGYKAAVSVSSKFNEVTSANVLADYEKALQLFREELESDYSGATENFVEEPYKSCGVVFDEVLSFMALEGYVKFEYEKIDGKDNYNKIEKVVINYNQDVINSKEAAINFVFEDKIENNFDQVVSYWQTASKLLTDFTAKAKEVLLKENMSDGSGMKYPNISGIVSLGHTTDTQTVTIGDNTYTVAHEHNADGTVKNSEEYDVLQITINGVDPKAIWSFAFSVAPQHYYAKGYTVDIANNKFGVEWASHEFMTNVIQATEVTKVPMGAGPYKATNKDNADNPKGNEFYSNNVVYFKANSNFMFPVKTEKLRYQVVSSSNALNALQAGSVHFVSPQLTDNNMAKIEELKSSGIESMFTDQLGYGYIGINAGKIPDINIRKAIMTAMDTSRAIDYYRSGTASTIYWPMSKVSWAYPKGDSEYDNGHSYPAIKFDENTAKAQIKEYMKAAKVSAGHSSLKITFTIAGANLTEHPAYNVFLNAAAILNDCGWNIEVVADTQALTKLSTGSLAVWAAAWGSTVDPDLYQVYHKNSTATSTLAWGYREILANPSKYSEENTIINELSDLIDQARETDNQAKRTELYEKAMKKILDLAVELPVYQRSVLYAYDSTVINKDTLPKEINPFSSPLDKIWEIELVG
ncbi:MAG: hypothetical protein E7667_00920 [Ruminococcaceae bacterium]|nr:hypothetical protein [Oscillospiraceae bacterium]